MNLLIISDLHANFPALSAVLAAEPDVEGIICLGDLVNYGPHPAECVRWARTETLPLWIVQGNHDHAFGCDEDPYCSPSYRPFAEEMQRVTASKLAPDEKKFLAQLPASLRCSLYGTTLMLCHAIPSDPLFGYCPRGTDAHRWQREVAIAGQPDFLFVGHTHEQFTLRIADTTIVDPGSVGQPKDGDPRAAYALWRDGEITMKRAAYDIEVVVADLFACAPENIAVPLAGVLRTGGELTPVQNQTGRGGPIPTKLPD